MNCIKCYQEIPEGSRFCPHCGAQQPDPQNSGSESVNMEPQPDVNIGPEAGAQTAQENPYQENSYQEGQNDSSPYQNQSYYGGYQNNNSSYQTPPSYQTGGQQPSVNWCHIWYCPLFQLSVAAYRLVLWRSYMPLRSTAL